MDNVFAYPAPVWSRFENPTLAHSIGGALQGAELARARVTTPASTAVLELVVSEHDARFAAFGDPVVIAVGQYLAQMWRAQGAAMLMQVSVEHLIRALEIPEDRRHCALLGEDLVLVLRRDLENPT